MKPPPAPTPRGTSPVGFPRLKKPSWKGVKGDISPWPQDAAADKEGRQGSERWKGEGGADSPSKPGGAPFRYRGFGPASIPPNMECHSNYCPQPPNVFLLADNNPINKVPWQR